MDEYGKFLKLQCVIISGDILPSHKDGKEPKSVVPPRMPIQRQEWQRPFQTAPGRWIDPLTRTINLDPWAGIPLYDQPRELTHRLAQAHVSGVPSEFRGAPLRFYLVQSKGDASPRALPIGDPVSHLTEPLPPEMERPYYSIRRGVSNEGLGIITRPLNFAMMEYDPQTGKPRRKAPSPLTGPMSPDMAANLGRTLEGFDPANHHGPRITPNWGQMTEMLKKDTRLDGADRFAISVRLINIQPAPGEALGDTVARVVEQYLAEKAAPKPEK